MRRIAFSVMLLLSCPGFWLWHILGALLCIPAFVYAWSPDGPDGGVWVATLALPFWSALVLTSLQRDLLGSPAGFCLPGQRDVLRRTSFLVGGVTSLMASLPILTYPGLDGLSLLSAIWSAWCFGLSVYLLMVRSLFLLDSVMTSLGPAMAVGFVLVHFPTARFFVHDVALFTPGWNTVILAALAIFAWRGMGSVDLARRTCGGRFLSLQMAWRRSAGEELTLNRRREVLSKGTWNVRRWILQQCFARIGRYPALSFRRFLAAMRYEVVGGLLPLTPWTTPLVVLVVLVLLVIVGYVPLNDGRSEIPEANAVYILSCVLAVQFGVPMFTTMIEPGGRRERFWGALAIAVDYGVVVLLVSLLMYVLLLAMGRLFPLLTFRGGIHDFRPADLAPAFVPLVLLPAILVLKILCKRWLFIPLLLLMSFALIFIVKGGAVIRALSLSTIIVLVSASWAILVSVLYIYSFRRDLVRK